MKDKYYPPKYNESNFHCPICGVFSHQTWVIVCHIGGDGFYQVYERLQLCNCEHCNEKSIWLDTNMIYPNMGGIPLPNPDLPMDVISDYNEARDIINKSPRGSSALLRLSIQKLCKHLGQTGKNINEDIAELVKQGLPIKVQQALDYVRVIGNNSVHPGQIDLKDNKEIALNLFSLINIIGEVLITQPKEIDNLYNSLPENQLDAIKKRDKKPSENKV